MIQYFILVWILCMLYLYWNVKQVETFANTITDQPSSNTPLKKNMFSWSIENQREDRYVVENNLLPGAPPSYRNFLIVPREPLWRIPVHPLVPPVVSDKGSGFVDYMGLLRIPLTWVAPTFQELKEETIREWTKKTSDSLEWPNHIEQWKWIPYPNNRQTVQQWNQSLWKTIPWRPPVSENKENQAPSITRFPDTYWETWAMDWLNRWNEEETKLFRDQIPANIRTRTLEYPFQYGRIWYIQGWDANQVRIMQYFGELIRPFGQIVFLLDWILVGNPNQFNERPRISVKWIGSRTYDQVWLPNGISNEMPQQSTAIANPNPETISWSQIGEEMKLKEDQTKKDRNFLRTSFACFIPNQENYSELLYASNRETCENRLDFLGRPKPQGVWDHACSSNEDCLFYGANQNYPNQFGRCMENGRCQWPIGMKPLGYHYWIPNSDSELFCYNCEGHRWLPDTEIKKCCEAQKDKTKYPFLKGPDYAYRGDLPERERHYEQVFCHTQNTKQTQQEITSIKQCGTSLPYIQNDPIQIIKRPMEQSKIPPHIMGYEASYNPVPGQVNATFISNGL